MVQYYFGENQGNLKFSFKKINFKKGKKYTMKSFMEEYGIVVVVAIVIVALIAVAVVFKNSGTTSIKEMLNNFLTQGGDNLGTNGVNLK